MTTIAAIQAAVCERFGLSRAEILKADRHRRVARPRQIGMYIAYGEGRLSRNQVGRHFGGLTPWTVLYACRRIEALRSKDPDIEAAVRELTEELSASHAAIAQELGS